MKRLIIILLILAVAGIAFAAAPAHKHGLMPAMKRQHQAMSQTNKHWQTCKKYLEKGDFKAAAAALGKMEKALAGLEKFQLHKNAEKAEEFKELAQAFKENLSQLGVAIKSKDSKIVASLSQNISDGCLKRHSTFR